MTDAQAMSMPQPNDRDGEYAQPETRQLSQREKDARRRQHAFRVSIGRAAVVYGDSLDPDQVPIFRLATYWGNTSPLGGTRDSRARRQQAAADYIRFLEGESAYALALESDQTLSAMNSRLTKTRDRIARYIRVFPSTGVESDEPALAPTPITPEMHPTIVRKHTDNYWDTEFASRQDRRQFVAAELGERFSQLKDCDFNALLSVDEGLNQTVTPGMVAAQNALKATLVDYLYLIPHVDKKEQRLSPEAMNNLLRFLGFKPIKMPDGKTRLGDTRRCITLAQYRAELRRGQVNHIEKIEKSLLDSCIRIIQPLDFSGVVG